MVLLSEWMASQVEFWRPTAHVGYDVSNFGRVRSWRTVAVSRTASGQVKGTIQARRGKPLILKPAVGKWGYYQISLFNNAGKRKSFRVHRLVALAFLVNSENLPSVNHVTGLKTDNRLDGLAWASRKEQAIHAWANGLHKRDRIAQARKMVDARKPYREVPDVLVRMIRNILASGISQGQVRRWSGLKHTTIQSIAVGRTYKDVA